MFAFSVVAACPDFVFAQSVEKLKVVYFTKGDDKDRDDEVEIIIRRGDKLYARSGVGKNVVWADHTSSEFSIKLDDKFAKSDCPSMTTQIKKIGSKNGWKFTYWLQGMYAGETTWTSLSESNEKHFEGENQEVAEPFNHCGK